MIATLPTLQRCNFSFTCASIIAQYFLYIYRMKIKEYLMTTDEINVAYVARQMFPSNKSAHTYISRKLNGTDGRSWTQKDEDSAKVILNQLGEKLKNL
jgi:hypothetical protein